MKIAVTSNDLVEVTAHAGRAHRFLVYAGDPGGEPQPLPPLEFGPELSMHEWDGLGGHPLDDVDVLIVASCGAHFVQRLASRGVLVVKTAHGDPLAAARQHLQDEAEGAVPEAAALAAKGCGCDGQGHEHEHEHEHAPGHGQGHGHGEGHGHGTGHCHH